MTATCSYEFSEEQWFEQRDDQKISEMERRNFEYFDNKKYNPWECPHPSIPNSDKCIFHLTKQEKEERGISSSEVVDQIIHVINDNEDIPPEFVGATFRELDFSNAVLSPNDNSQIDFSFSNFYGKLLFERANVDDITFSQASFHSYVQLHLGNFNQRAIFYGAEFFEKPHLDPDFHGYVNFDCAIFHDDVWFQGEFKRGASCRQVNFKGQVDMYSCQFSDRLSFRDASFQREVDLSHTTVNELLLAPQSTEQSAFINLGNSTIESGYLSMPDQGTMYISLENANIGDVQIRDGVFDYLVFKDTNFEGFQFERYRPVFRERNWDLNMEFAFNSHEITVTPAEVELTYLKARQGAKSSGDKVAATQFFIKELRSRRDYYAQKFRTIENMVSKLKYLYLYSSNWIYDSISKYGESPARVIATGALTILLCAALYPILGGIERSGSPPITDGTTSKSLLDVFGTSLYFSGTTFTTVGYGDLRPGSELTAALATGESLIGAILVALLIFVMGRTIQR